MDYLTLENINKITKKSALNSTVCASVFGTINEKYFKYMLKYCQLSQQTETTADKHIFKEERSERKYYRL